MTFHGNPQCCTMDCFGVGGCMWRQQNWKGGTSPSVHLLCLQNTWIQLIIKTFLEYLKGTNYTYVGILEMRKGEGRESQKGVLPSPTAKLKLASILNAMGALHNKTGTLACYRNPGLVFYVTDIIFQRPYSKLVELSSF